MTTKKTYNEKILNLLKKKNLYLNANNLKTTKGDNKLFQLAPHKESYTIFIATNRRDTIKEAQYKVIKDIKPNNEKALFEVDVRDKNLHPFVKIVSNDLDYLEACIDKVMTSKGYKKEKKEKK